MAGSPYNVRAGPMMRKLPFNKNVGANPPPPPSKRMLFPMAGKGESPSFGGPRRPSDEFFQEPPMKR